MVPLAMSTSVDICGGLHQDDDQASAKSTSNLGKSGSARPTVAVWAVRILVAELREDARRGVGHERRDPEADNATGFGEVAEDIAQAGSRFLITYPRRFV